MISIYRQEPQQQNKDHVSSQTWGKKVVRRQHDKRLTELEFFQAAQSNKLGWNSTSEIIFIFSTQDFGTITTRSS